MADAEHRADIGALGAGAHHAAVGAVAEAEAEGIHEDGLAGAGLAGDDGEAGREFQLQVLDDGELADAQQTQHGGIRYGGLPEMIGQAGGRRDAPMSEFFFFRP